ncbi:MAG: Rieske (2Fe-2S) protein [Chloroflexi bacterium]|nr:Rieske (2Fe-2S) protein [Chloroflexota bacterium]
MSTERRRGTVTMRQVSGSARSRKVRVELGDEASFTELPAPVKVGDASYFLVRGRDGYKLLSTMCPHQGGEIEDEGDEVFVCDGHGWQYEKGDGRCVNNPDFRMKAFLVTVQNDRLVALVPDE